MTPGHWLMIWQVETRKLLSRTIARAGLAIAVLFAVFMPMALQWFSSSEMLVNGSALGELYSATAPEALEWTIWLRNFWFMRLFILALAGLSFAGELKDRTLREDLIQPVSRTGVFLAKWAALVTWDAIALMLGVGIASGLGVIFFGTDGGWQMPLMAAATSLLCDTAIAAVALCAATFARSVAMTLVFCLLFLICDFIVGLGLTLGAMVAEMAELPALFESVLQLQPWMPSTAFAVWTSFAGGEPWVWQNFASLAGIIGGCLCIGAMRLHFTDVH